MFGEIFMIIWAVSVINVTFIEPHFYPYLNRDENGSCYSRFLWIQAPPGKCL